MMRYGVSLKSARLGSARVGSGRVGSRIKLRDHLRLINFTLHMGSEPVSGVSF